MKLRKLRKLRNYLVIASHHASEIHIDIKRGLCAGIPACCIYFYMVTFSTMCSYEQVLPRGEIGPWRKYMKWNREGFFWVACPLCKLFRNKSIILRKSTINEDEKTSWIEAIKIHNEWQRK